MNTVTPTTAKAYFLTNGTVRDKYGDTLFHPLSNVNMIEIYVEDGDSDNVVTINYNPEVRKKWATHWFPCFYRGLVEYTLDGESDPRTFAQYITYMPAILSSMNQNSETAMGVTATLRQQAGNNLIGSYSTVASLPTSYGDWLDMQDLEENDVVAYVYESGLNGFYMVEYADPTYTWTLQTSGINNYVSTKQYDTWELSVQAGFGNPAEITELTDAQYMLIWQELSSLSASIVSNDDDLADLLDGTTPVGKAVADQNGAVIDTTYEKLANKKSAFQETPTNDAYPTEKLTKDTIDALESAVDVKLDLKEDLTNKLTAFQEIPDDTHYISEKLAKDTTDALDVRVTVNEEDLVILIDAITEDGIDDIMLKSIYDTNDDGIIDEAYLSSYLPSPTEDQLLDNRTNFSVWTLTGVGSVIDGDYIKLVVSDPILETAKVDKVLSATTQYTLMYEITYNDTGTSLYLHPNSWFANTALTSAIGIYSKLVTTKSSTTYDMVKFHIGNATNGTYIKFRAVLFLGDLTELTESQMEDLILNAEFGDCNYNVNAENIYDKIDLKAPQATTYTKDEVDAKVSALYRFKGSVATYADLAAKEATAVNGDVWNVTTDETTGNAGVNYAWTGSAWDNIGGVEALASATNDGLMSQADFSKLLALPTNTALNLLFADKVDKVTGYALSKNDYDDTEKAQVLASKEDVVTLEHLVLMTYVSSGQFKATVDNFALSLNRDLQILFPNTTSDLTTAVQVSFDNGVTYKYLKYDDTLNSVVVKHTQNLKTDIYYDNTEWFMKGAPLVSESLTFTEMVNSHYGVLAGINGIPEISDIYGLSLYQPLDGSFTAIGSWTALNSSNGISSGVLQNTGSGASTSPRARHSAVTSAIATDKFYLEFYARVTNALATNIEMQLFYSGGQQTVSLGSAPTINVWYKISGILTVPSGGDGDMGIDLVHRYGSTADANGAVMETDYAMAIPITNTPLASKTATQMNAIVPTYFEGSKHITNPEYKTVGLNLIDIKEFVAGKLNSSNGTYEGTTGASISIDGGELSITTTITYKGAVSGFIPVKGGEAYTAKAVLVSGSASNPYIAGYYCYDHNQNWIEFLSNTDLEATSTLDSNCAYVRISLLNATVTTSSVKDIQVEEGSTASDYVAYNSPATNFKLLNKDGTDLPMLSVGSIRDKAYYLNSEWWKDKEVDIDTTVVASATTWGIKGALTNTHIFHKDLSASLDYKLPADNDNIAEVFIVVNGVKFNNLDANTNFSADTENVFSINATNEDIEFRVNKTTFANTGAWETELALGTTFIYEIDEMVTTEIEANGSVIQGKNTTVISQNDFATEISMVFNSSIKAQLQTHSKKLIYLQEEADKINSSGVFAYLASSTNTTCTNADTWYSIDGTFTNDVAKDFSVATVVTPGIKYDGSKTQYFEIDYHASLAGDATGTTVHLGVKKNGVIITGSKMGTFLKVIAEKQALSGTCVISLEQDDEIQLVIMADGAGDVISVVHYTTTIRQF